MNPFLNYFQSFIVRHKLSFLVQLFYFSIIIYFFHWLWWSGGLKSMLIQLAFFHQTETFLAHQVFLPASWMGNGWFVAVLFLVLLFVKVRYALMLLAGNVLITIVIQGIKHLVFPGTPRPLAYFNKLHESLHLIHGEHMHMYNSFPSGHSATAFGLFILMIFITRNQWLKFVWLIMAAFIAFSRIYLSQHFLVDVEFGALLGALIMMLTIYLFEIYAPEKGAFSIINCPNFRKS